MVGVYTILISLPLTLSLIRCCLTLRCLVLGLPPPFVSKLIVDMLPYKRYGMYVVMYNMYPNRYKSRDSDIRLILNTDSRALMRSSY